jgi:hypothetical protein
MISSAWAVILSVNLTMDDQVEDMDIHGRETQNTRGGK